MDRPGDCGRRHLHGDAGCQHRQHLATEDQLFISRAAHKSALHDGHLQAVFIQAFHTALLACAVIAALGVFTSMMRGPKQEGGH
jgi:hypothetical protein